MDGEFNIFPELMAAMDKAAAQLVKKAAFDIQAKASKNNGWQHPTGFLDSSIYVVTKDSSSYGSDVSGAGELLPEVEPPTTVTEAYVAVGASYGIFQELGTRSIPPHPYLTPAAEAVRPSFVESMSRLEDKMLENL